MVWKPSLFILFKFMKCSEVSHEVVYSWRRKRKDDALFHNTAITVNPLEQDDFGTFFGNGILMLCFCTFLHIYFFFVFFVCEDVLYKSFTVHFYI